ncbi:hypothetical protein [Saccharothrix sp.]|nr:hypothetical protein [Saccharothrix sp.]
MVTDLLLGALIDIAITALVIFALLFTCAAMIPPRPPSGPRRP